MGALLAVHPLIGTGQQVSHGAYRFRAIRHLLEHPSRQENFEFMEKHPLIREKADYGEFIKVHFRKEEA